MITISLTPSAEAKHEARSLFAHKAITGESADEIRELIDPGNFIPHDPVELATYNFRRAVLRHFNKLVADQEAGK